MNLPGDIQNLFNNISEKINSTKEVNKTDKNKETDDQNSILKDTSSIWSGLKSPEAQDFETATNEFLDAWEKLNNSENTLVGTGPLTKIPNIGSVEDLKNLTEQINNKDNDKSNKETEVIRSTLDENIRNALFFNILKFAWGLSLDKESTTVLCVDEAHVLLSTRNELGAEFLAQIQRRARKYNTGTIIITQQPTDFAAQNLIVHGKAIFDNASYYLVMGLKKQAAEDLSKLIDLNDNEKESIKGYSQGEALFVCGNRRMRINVILTPEELASFGSGGGL